MKQLKQRTLPDEPVGIVISSGVAGIAPPRVSAYVWGPVPDDPEPAVSAAR